MSLLSHRSPIWKEISTKSEAQIEKETAYKWAERAIVCFEKAKKSRGARRDAWMKRAENYKHESLEHGALVGDQGKTVAQIENLFWMEQHA